MDKSIYGVELIRGEDVVDSFNPSFFRFLKHYIISLGLVMLGGWFYFFNADFFNLVSAEIIFLYVSGAGVLWLILTLVANKAELLVITNKRMIYKKGVLNISTTDLDLDKIQNTTVKQTFFERVFNYGNLKIDTSGSEGFEIIFRGAPSISRKRLILNSVMESSLDAVKEHKKAVSFEKKLESKEKTLEELKMRVKDLEKRV